MYGKYGKYDKYDKYGKHDKMVSVVQGAMLHAGAIIANVVSQLTARYATIFPQSIRFDFSNDYDRRNLVSMGAAAGVAAAFNAPIGGTLFALEEVSVVSIRGGDTAYDTYHTYHNLLYLLYSPYSPYSSYLL